METSQKTISVFCNGRQEKSCSYETHPPPPAPHTHLPCKATPLTSIQVDGISLLFYLWTSVLTELLYFFFQRQCHNMWVVYLKLWAIGRVLVFGLWTELGQRESSIWKRYCCCLMPPNTGFVTFCINGLIPACPSADRPSWFWSPFELTVWVSQSALWPVPLWEGPPVCPEEACPLDLKPPTQRHRIRTRSKVMKMSRPSDSDGDREMEIPDTDWETWLKYS